MPRCFSRPICQFAASLNDTANHRNRQRLLPFVIRLACADDDDVEQQRQSYIWFGLNYRFTSFDEGIKILEGALSIGGQADPLGFSTVEKRLSAVKEKASAARPRSENPIVLNVKKWLETAASAA